MIFKFISNASCIIEGENGSRILTDPWFNNGVMEGSWCNHPPIDTRTADFHDVDLIYLSHLHPDHYDERFFDFPKSIPIVILDHGNNYLQKILLRKGYDNLLLIKNKNTIQFKEFKITLFAPFVKHAFEDMETLQKNSIVGNLIDSAMLVETKNFSVMNFNDNKPDIESCKILKEQFGIIDLALLNYNAANCYPACFDNLNDQEKINEKNRIIKRNYDYMIELINALTPTTVFPFAGSYILGGREHVKNKYLAAESADDCKKYIEDKVGSNVINLSEKNRFDLSSEKILDKFKDFTEEETEDLINNEIKHIVYPFEDDENPDEDLLIKEIKEASLLMKKRMQKFGFECKTNVYINVNGKLIEIHKVEGEEVNLECSMNLKLLRRILNRSANWNNAEIGAHINYFRAPNIYEPDIHTALQFLHL